MSRRYLLDTNVVSAPMAKKPEPKILSRLERHGEECVIAAPVWHELVFGCARLPVGRKRLALQAYLDDVVLRVFPVLPYDQEAARWHGVERARLESVGTSPPFVDGQIAAVAYVNELTLVTTNVDDFKRFAGLKVEDWSVL